LPGGLANTLRTIEIDEELADTFLAEAGRVVADPSAPSVNTRLK
jgi:hypothetical protein